MRNHVLIVALCIVGSAPWASGAEGDVPTKVLEATKQELANLARYLNLLNNGAQGGERLVFASYRSLVARSAYTLSGALYEVYGNGWAENEPQEDGMQRLQRLLRLTKQGDLTSDEFDHLALVGRNPRGTLGRLVDDVRTLTGNEKPKVVPTPAVRAYWRLVSQLHLLVRASVLRLADENDFLAGVALITTHLTTAFSGKAQTVESKEVLPAEALLFLSTDG